MTCGIGVASGDTRSASGVDLNLTNRAVCAIGLLAALTFPPLQPLAHACRLESLEEPGRRGACEAMVNLMERSDKLITQSLALSIQERWCPAESSQREAVNAIRHRLDYLIAMMGQSRPWDTMSPSVLMRHATARAKRMPTLRPSEDAVSPSNRRPTGRIPSTRDSKNPCRSSYRSSALFAEDVYESIGFAEHRRLV
jgi:hypothetical protein